MFALRKIALRCRFSGPYGFCSLWPESMNKTALSSLLNMHSFVLGRDFVKGEAEGLRFRPKAQFECRTSHVPNRMLIRKIFCSNSFALDSAHEKFDVRPGLILCSQALHSKTSPFYSWKEVNFRDK